VNVGFCARRRFPPPWSVEETGACFIVRDHGRRAGTGINKVARELGVGSGTVQRVRQEMHGPFADAAA
jgi:hypothetical protein